MLLFAVALLLASIQAAGSSDPRCTEPQPPGASAFRPGDLVFVRPKLHPGTSSLDAGILATGAATINWLRAQGVAVRGNQTATHVALALRNVSTGCLSFVQAVPPSVTVTLAPDFWHSTLPTTTFYRAWFVSALQHPPQLDFRRYFTDIACVHRKTKGCRRSWQ